MQAWQSIGLNLVAAFLGFLASHGVSRFRHWTHFRGERAFWKSLAGGQGTFVIGQLEPSLLLETAVDILGDFLDEPRREELFNKLVAHLKDQENSGLIGLGDLEALFYINSRLAEAGVPRILSMRRAERIEIVEGMRLVILGSDDMNSLCRDLSEDLGCTFRVKSPDGRNIVHDSTHDTIFRRESEPLLDGKGRRDRDYGVLVRAPASNYHDVEVLIIAGAQGLGTLAAARACFDRTTDFVNFAGRYPEGFECIVGYERRFDVGGRLVADTIDLISLRALPKH